MIISDLEHLKAISEATAPVGGYFLRYSQPVYLYYHNYQPIVLEQASVVSSDGTKGATAITAEWGNSKYASATAYAIGSITN